MSNPNKQLQQLYDVFIELNKKAIVLEEAQRQEVMQLEGLVNRELTTRRKEVKESAEKEKTKKEEDIAIKQQKLQQELEKVLDNVETQINQVTSHVPKEVTQPVKHTNFHYQQKQPVKAPQVPQPPQKQDKKEQRKRPSIAEQARMNSVKKTKDILHQIEELKAKKQTVTGKVTETPFVPKPVSASSKSLDKTKLAKDDPPIQQPSKQSKPNQRQFQPRVPKPPSSTTITSKPSLSLDSKPPPPISTTPFPLQSFHNKDYLLLLKQHSKSKHSLPPTKSLLDLYQKQQLGYRQEENRSRMSFLKLLNKYAPCKRNVNREFTDKIQKRGWRGCDYIVQFKEAVRGVDRDEIEGLMGNKKAKVINMYRKAEEIVRLMANWKRIQEEKKSIVAPKVADVHFQFNPIKKKNNLPAKTLTLSKPISLDKFLQPAYRIIRPMLQQYLQKDTLSKHDLKTLVGLLNLVLSNNRKSFTVIPKSQLQSFLSMISQQY